MEEKNNLDDLIGTTGQPIVVQESSSDKKFLYIIIALLILLFIIALGVIAFIGGKYFGNSNTQAPPLVTPTTPTKIEKVVDKQETVAKKEVVKQEIASKPTVKEIASTSKEEPQESKEVAQEETPDINELEKIVQEQAQEQKQPKQEEVKESKETNEQKVIAKAASAATGGKTLSQEELAKIAKLVAQELAKTQANKAKSNGEVKQVTDNKDEELVASLQSAQTDTLKSEDVTTTNLQDTKVKSGPAKKVDTFNKVIVEEKSGGDDEIAKLTAEIDSILKSEEVSKQEKSLKYGKELKQEIVNREREMRFIVVKPGDTLSSLAYKAYGRASAYVKIYKANPDLVKNPNKIYVGMRLRVPVDEEYLKQQGR